MQEPQKEPQRHAKLRPVNTLSSVQVQLQPSNNDGVPLPDLPMMGSGSSPTKKMASPTKKFLATTPSSPVLTPRRNLHHHDLPSSMNTPVMATSPTKRIISPTKSTVPLSPRPTSMMPPSPMFNATPRLVSPSKPTISPTKITSGSMIMTTALTSTNSPSKASLQASFIISSLKQANESPHKPYLYDRYKPHHSPSTVRTYNSNKPTSPPHSPKFNVKSPTRQQLLQ